MQAELLAYFQSKEQEGIQVLLNTTSFRSRDWKLKHPSLICGDNWTVLQVILSGGSAEAWEAQFQGLSAI